jgi:hypothetical protein
MRVDFHWRSLRLLHPLAFSLSPVVSLLAENYGEISPSLSYRSFVAVTAAGLLGWAVLSLLLRDGEKAAAVSSVGALLFFSYGHVYVALETVHLFGVQLGRHRHLIPLYGLLFSLAVWAIVRRIRARSSMTMVLAAAGLAMLSISAGSLGLRVLRSNSGWAQTVRQGPAEGPTPLSHRPDIYYIILDGYARPDVMTIGYGFDTSEFVEELRQSGFFLAEHSSANYMWTALSIASSLNMRFVQDLGIPLPFGSYPGVFADPIRHSRLRFELERLGYGMVSIESGYRPTEIEDADHYLQAAPTEAGRTRPAGGLNAFETLLAHSSGGLVVLDLLGPRLYEWVGFRSDHSYEVLRTIILESFNSLEDSVTLPSPKFVFAHIVAPHRPYLLGRDGQPIDPTDDFALLGEPGSAEDVSNAVLYRDQAYYISGRVVDTVARILNRSQSPPVIIIQSDHGPAFGQGSLERGGEAVWQRLAILNLYHLPHGCDRLLYPTISPVNSFRLVLSCYFGLDYPLLQDLSYFSFQPRLYPYEFELVQPLELQSRYPLER